MQKMTSMFSISGRISRGRFWFLSLIVWLLLYAVTQATPDWSGIGLAIINAPFLVFLITLCVRRLHDCHYSGWRLLLVLVPIAGAIWLTLQLAFRKGVADTNQWGANPLTISLDYLTVK